MKKLKLALLPLVLWACVPVADDASVTPTMMAVTTPTVEEGAILAEPENPSTDERLQPQLSKAMGHIPANFQNWLGQPDFVRWDGDVQVFQFKNSSCILDVYFYRENIEQNFVAHHVDARSNEGLGLNEQSCFESFFADGEVPEALVEAPK